MAANTELSGELEGRVSNPGDTATRDGKDEIRKSACKDRLGNTGQASKQARGGKNRKITGSIFHRSAVVRDEKGGKKIVDIRQSETRSNCKQHLKREKSDQQKGGAYGTEAGRPRSRKRVLWKLGHEKGTLSQ